MDTRHQLLQDREVKLKKMLLKLEQNRDILRENRRKKQVPTVAVVGYTNCGKTTLIKALTHDESLIPKNVLFATLDVTVHKGRLPSNMNILYTDTIGFISNIPITLIQSFNSTLKDICTADLIIHVRDVSHPDQILQNETVNKTLNDINVPERLTKTLIEVCNKIDLVKDPHIHKTDRNILISATEGIGLDELKNLIEERLVQNTSQLHKILRQFLIIFI